MSGSENLFESLWHFFSDGTEIACRDAWVMKAAACGVLFSRTELSLIFEGRDRITKREFRMWYENTRLLSE